MSKPARIAVVGVGGLFPQSPTLDDFWRLLIEGRSAAADIPAHRWRMEPDRIFHPEVGRADALFSRRGCLLPELQPVLNLDGVDLDPDILQGLDPLFKILLHCARATLLDARDGIDRARTGIIVGNLVLPTESASELAMQTFGRTFAERLGKTTNHSSEVSLLNRYLAGLPAGLVAKGLGLGLGGFTLDAACASSLYAIKLAVDALQSGQADVMLTGGVSRPDPLYTQMGFSQLRALSPTGTCSPFDQRGNGLVVGEGCGLFLLKRLDDALRDGNQIYGLICGAGLSNDIGGGLLAPSSEGQLRAMRAAYRQAGWTPDMVDHIECHATGTLLGDAVEFGSLLALREGSSARQEKTVIGSVKSNIGHLLTAAGSAALMKTLLGFKHQEMPPTANFANPGKDIPLDNSPYQVLRTATPWPLREDGTSRKAAVSAFGFGGINAHLLVEEYLPEPAPKRTTKAKPAPVPEVAIVGIDVAVGPWQDLRSFQYRTLGTDLGEQPVAPSTWRGSDSSEWFRKTGLAIPKGYFLNEVTPPLGRFRIPPKEMEEMLPQQLQMLQVADRALVDAGIDSQDLTDAGVFIGIGIDMNATNFHHRWQLGNLVDGWNQGNQAERGKLLTDLRDQSTPPLTANRTMGALGSIVASRVAREFRFGGPCYTISAEEHSGMRALQTAVSALQQGEINSALVGAVDLTSDLRNILADHEVDRLLGFAGDRTYADGTVALVLKRLDEAVADGDRVYAVIGGVETASGATPAENRQRSVSNLLERTDEKGSSIGLYEVASRLPECDDTTLQLLGERSDAVPLYLGNTAINNGFCGAASGLLSVVRGALSLYQQIIPGTLAATGQESGSVVMPRSPRFWLQNSGSAKGPEVRRALIGSCSPDGSFTHALLRETSVPLTESAASERVAPTGPLPERLIRIHASGVDELAATLRSLLAQLANDGNAPVPTLPEPDTSLNLRLALISTNAGELRSQIEAILPLLAGRPLAELIRMSRSGGGLLGRGRAFIGEGARFSADQIAFVYPGSGNHYAEMGRELSFRWPGVFRQQQAENAFLADQYQGGLFWNPTSRERIAADHLAMIYGQVAQGTAGTDLLTRFSITPAAAIGYSLGESAALFSTRTWRDRDLMLERMRTSTLFTEDLAGPCTSPRRQWQLKAEEEVNWKLGLIPLPAEEVRPLLRPYPHLYLLIVNTPQECVIGGKGDELDRLMATLDTPFFPIEGVTSVHCEAIEPVADAYHELHLYPTKPPKGLRFYSGSRDKSFAATRTSAAASIIDNARFGIDYPRTIEAAYADGLRIFIEPGPGNSCCRMISQILKEREHLCLPLQVTGQPLGSTVLRLLASLSVEGLDLDLAPLTEESTIGVRLEGKHLSFPVGLPVPQPKLPVAPQPATASNSAIQPATKPTAPTASAPVPAISPAPAVATPVSGAQMTENNPYLTAEVVSAMQDSMAATIAAHERYLAFSANLTATMASAIEQQIRLVSGGDVPVASVTTSAPAVPVTPAAPARPKPLIDRDLCMEFAVGSIAKVLGPAFAQVDSYPTRVRLPDEPLMLVDRITLLEGEANSMGGGRVVTEHDVKPGAWYLDGNRIPTCVAVEAGQADLFLSGYLGIDSITRGKAVYRLLDAVVTFHRGLPQPGETIVYDIYIDHFFKQDQTYLFRFRFEGSVNGEPLLTMEKGCAGFFTQAELESGKGIVHTKLDLMPQPGKRPADWRELAPLTAIESYNEAQIDALYAGDLAGCFGAPFDRLGLRNPFTLPGGLLKLVDRVVSVEPTGGKYGIGRIVAEMDIDPNDWFLTCHFVDDMVMPGTLMYECCMHTLRVYLMRIGWVAEEGESWCEPLPGIGSQLKCRGQVLQSTKKVTYEVTIKEIGYRPEPFVIVTALMYADGKPIVEIGDMTAHFPGLSRELLERRWQQIASGVAAPAPQKQILYDRDKILAYAVGNPSEGFGEPYKIFDSGRIIARLPGPPFMFLDRIIEVSGEPFKLQPGAHCVGEYDSPADAWYFSENNQRQMPFAVLLEIALQPCGWLAAYVGSALASPVDISFRNLGGTAVWHRPVTPETGMLTMYAKLTKVAKSGGMIIQDFEFRVSDAQGPVYTGTTVFGFFTKDALANQVGVRDAKRYLPSPEEMASATGFDYPDQAPFPSQRMKMIDRVSSWAPAGGSKGLGFIRGEKDVIPGDWFFKAHFYQDPVCPGSLGLESFLQLLKVVAVERWGGNPDLQLQNVAIGAEHSWLYRGQIIEKNKLVTVEADITAIDDAQKRITASGFLMVDDKVIYQMINFTIKVVE